MSRRGNEPRFDLDRDYGEDGEDTVRRVLGLSGSRIEVKRKRREDDQFFLELRHAPGRRGDWQASGLNVTAAEYWAFLVGDTGVIVLAPTALLRLLVGRAP